MRGRAMVFAAILGISAVFVGLAPVAAVAPDQSTSVQPMEPQPLADFDPGNIIDDAVFFADDTMTVSQIQSFLQERVPTCRSGYTCLKDFVAATASRPADAMCRADYIGRDRETAAEIIYNVAQACGINPQVILVTLQKEQGLVTHTWPSDWRFRLAMGQGCPDAGACDTRYYGFFNQVYGAAWQFKRYANPPGTSAYFTWYAPGRTWNIRFHPDAACGSSPVRIANQATANLYYYTPYQPNAAALAAGFGAGDACSSYGNRNFFNYFTEWFGSTRSTTITLAKSESSSTVWILGAAGRWAIVDVPAWNELSRVFGPTYIVSDTYLRGFAERGPAANIVRDPSSGQMSLVDGGRSWAFTSCSDVELWGGSCANPVDIVPSVYRRAPVGPQVGVYLRVPSGPLWGRLEAGTVRLLHDAASATRLNEGVTPIAPVMPARALALRPQTAVYFGPGELVRLAKDPTVYLVDGFTALRPLATFATVAEMGIATGTVKVVDERDFAGYGSRDRPLTPLLGCGSTTGFPAGGTLYPLRDPAATGLASAPLEPETCAGLRIDAAVLPTLLVKTPTDATVYVVVGGVRRALNSWIAAIQVGGSSPRVVTVSAEWMGTVPLGPPYLGDGTLVKGSGPMVYLTNGGFLLPVPSFSIARELGLGTGFVQLSDEDLAAQGQVGEPIGLWIRCDGADYVAAGSVLHRLTLMTDGFRASLGSASLCSRLDLAGVSLSQVFVKGSTPTVYLATGGVYRPISSWSRLLAETSGNVPPILSLSDETIAALPIGSVLL